jgi:iron(III) transport system permease protein
LSRPLVVLALAVFVIAGILPIAAMAGRVGAEDLATVLGPRTLPLLGRTALLGGGAAAVAVLLGVPFGFLTARTDVFGATGLLPLLIPPLILAVAQAALLPDLRGAPATILVLGASTFPIVALFTARAFERIDARREESALLAGGLRAVLAVELPLVLPSVLCAAFFAFVFVVNDFAVPDYVSSVGVKYNVYADEIFASWQTDRQAGRAVAAALPLVVLTLAALVPPIRFRRSGVLATIDADWKRPARLRLGAWRWPALAFVLAVVAATAVAPITRLVWEAGGGTRGWSGETLGASFAKAFDVGRMNLRQSLVDASLAALLCAPVALVLGHALGRARKGRALELAAVLPIAVPAILFGIGAIVVWNRDWTARFYESDAMVVTLMVGRFAVFPVLIVAGAVAMLDRRLEEAAAMAGARPARRLVSIVAPSIAGSLLGGAALVFVLCLRELDAAILVPAANGTILFRIYNAVHFGRDDFVAALALLAIFFVVLPGLAWSLFARKRLEVLP